MRAFWRKGLWCPGMSKSCPGRGEATFLTESCLSTKVWEQSVENGGDGGVSVWGSGYERKEKNKGPLRGGGGLLVVPEQTGDRKRAGIRP